MLVSQNPVWQEEFRLCAYSPSPQILLPLTHRHSSLEPSKDLMADYLEVVCWDWDRVGRDFIGHVLFPLTRLRTYTEYHQEWFTLSRIHIKKIREKFKKQAKEGHKRLKEKKASLPNMRDNLPQGDVLPLSMSEGVSVHKEKHYNSKQSHKKKDGKGGGTSPVPSSPEDDREQEPPPEQHVAVAPKPEQFTEILRDDRVVLMDDRTQQEAGGRDSDKEESVAVRHTTEATRSPEQEDRKKEQEARKEPEPQPEAKKDFPGGGEQEGGVRSELSRSNPLKSKRALKEKRSSSVEASSPPSLKGPEWDSPLSALLKATAAGDPQKPPLVSHAASLFDSPVSMLGAAAADEDELSSLILRKAKTYGHWHAKKELWAPGKYFLLFALFMFLWSCINVEVVTRHW